MTNKSSNSKLIEELEDRIVTRTIDDALKISANLDVGTHFPSRLKSIKKHPERFADSVYASLELKISEAAYKTGRIRLDHIYYGGTACEFIVHAK